MQVALSSFTSALSKISALTAGDKQVGGVLLRIREDHLQICFNDLTKAITEKIPAIYEEGDLLQDIAVDFKPLEETISKCQPTANTVAEHIKLSFEDGNILRIECEKSLKIQTEDGVILGSGSSVNQPLKWNEPTANPRLGILTRIDYDGLVAFDANSDAWGAGELSSILSRLVNEKTSVCYISPKIHTAFVPNLAYVACIPVPEDKSIAFSAKSSITKSLADILARIKDFTVHLTLNPDNQSYKLCTDDGNFGMWFQLTKPNSTHINTVSRYREKEYNTYQFTITRELLVDGVKNTIMGKKSDKLVLRFTGDNSERFVEILASSSLDSSHGKFRIKCAGSVSGNGIDETMDFEVPLSTAALSSILDDCNTPYVAFDIQVEEGGTKIVRISEIDLLQRIQDELDVKYAIQMEAQERLTSNTSNNPEADAEMCRLDITQKEEAKKIVIPSSKLLEIRKHSLLACHYCLSMK